MAKRPIGADLKNEAPERTFLKSLLAPLGCFFKPLKFYWEFLGGVTKYRRRRRELNQGFFFYTFEKTQGEKNLNFSAFGRKLKPYFFKNPKLLEILSTWQFFSKNLNIFKAVKGIFCVCLTQSLTKTARSAQKKSIFPPIFAWNNWFSQETQAIWKKLKQLLGKTQENIQKLKQNEHQVLSCSQKKCKIKTPELRILW